MAQGKDKIVQGRENSKGFNTFPDLLNCLPLGVRAESGSFFVVVMTFAVKFFDFQAQNVELSEEVKRLKETEEEQQRALRALEQATTKLETDKIKQHAKAVSWSHSAQVFINKRRQRFCDLSTRLNAVNAFRLWL